MNEQANRNRRVKALLLTSTAAFLLAGQAVAQAPAAPTGAVEEVVVTSSRIVRDGFAAPTPVTVVGPEELAAAATPNIAEYVNRMPQLQGSNTARRISGMTGPGLQGANVLNLRSLSNILNGENRTLVLLDGRRVAPVTPGGAVDINVLPSALMERVDIVTGGASAAWGSDAVAGVVNFILDKKFTGIKGEVQLGTTTHWDAETQQYTLSVGTPFAGGRGHFLASGEHTISSAGDPIISRDWFNYQQVVNNPAYVAGSGIAGRVLADNINHSLAAPGGLITAGPLKGTTFGAGGVPERFVYGIVSGATMIGGTQTSDAGIIQLVPADTRSNLFSRVSFDVTDAATVYAEASYARDEVNPPAAYYIRNNDIVIRSDNPFIPASTKAQMTAAGLASFNFGRLFNEFGPTANHHVRKQVRGVIGADGRFGSTGSWHTYYQYGRSNVLNAAGNNPIVPRVNAAVDVISNPAVNGVAGVAAGAPVCRSRLTAPNNGCIPLNLFGTNSASPEAIASVIGVAWRDLEYVQEVAAFSGQFEPFSIWAGPVSLAAGVEWRKEEYVQKADPISLTATFYLGNFTEGTGKESVREAFAETVVPLLRDAPLAKSLDFNGAIRFTDYGISGGVKTWKAGFVYDMDDSLRLRATRSRDIRAANLAELFQGAAGTQTFVLEDSTLPGNPPPATTVVTFNRGNLALTPELADTTSFGGIYRPAWFSGFSVAVDYWKIELNDAITTPTLPGRSAAQTVIDQCAGYRTVALPAQCANITRGALGTVNTVTVGPVNSQAVETGGIDLEVAYRMPLYDGELNLRFLGTYVDKYLTTQVGGLPLDTLDIGGPRRYRGLFTATYEKGPSRTTLTARYIGEGRYSAEPPGSATQVVGNRIPAVTYFDLAESYDLSLFGSKSQVFAVMENVLDEDPPAGGGVLFDPLGRQIRVGLRFSF